jgi:hypothetical protein
MELCHDEPSVCVVAWLEMLQVWGINTGKIEEQDQCKKGKNNIEMDESKSHKNKEQ